MADATAVIRAFWPNTSMLGKTISERLPKVVIEFVMKELVRPHLEVFKINGVTEEMLPAAGVLGQGGDVRGEGAGSRVKE